MGRDAGTGREVENAGSQKLIVNGVKWLKSGSISTGSSAAPNTMTATVSAHAISHQRRGNRRSTARAGKRIRRATTRPTA